MIVSDGEFPVGKSRLSLMADRDDRRTLTRYAVGWYGSGEV